jgi:hypothetical protein
MDYSYQLDKKNRSTLKMNPEGVEIVDFERDKIVDTRFFSFNSIEKVVLYTSDIGLTVCHVHSSEHKEPMMILSHTFDKEQRIWQRTSSFDQFIQQLHRSVSEASPDTLYYDGHPLLHYFLKSAYWFTTLFLSATLLSMAYFMFDKPHKIPSSTGELISLVLVLSGMLIVWLKLLTKLPAALRWKKPGYSPDQIPKKYLSPSVAE